MLYVGKQFEHSQRELGAYSVSLDRALDASYDLAAMIQPTVSLNEHQRYRVAQMSQRKLSDEEAYEKIRASGLDLKVPDGGLTSTTLDMLIEEKKKETKLQAIQARGPEGHFMRHMGSQFAAAAVDPLNIGTSFIPITGQARMGYMLARAAQSAGVAGRAGVRIGVGSAEVGVISAALEVPTYMSAQKRQLDYDMSHALMNVAFGMAFGGLIRPIAGYGADLYRYGKSAKPTGLDRLVEEYKMKLPDAETRARAERRMSDQEVEDLIFKGTLDEMSEGGRHAMVRTMLDYMVRNVDPQKVVKLIMDADLGADISVKGFNRQQIKMEIDEGIEGIVNMLNDAAGRSEVRIPKVGGYKGSYKFTEVVKKSREFEKLMKEASDELYNILKHTSYKRMAATATNNPARVAKFMDEMAESSNTAKNKFSKLIDDLSNENPRMKQNFDRIKNAVLDDSESFLNAPIKRAEILMDKVVMMDKKIKAINDEVIDSFKPDRSLLGNPEGAARSVDEYKSIIDTEDASKAAEIESVAVAEWKAVQKHDLDYEGAFGAEIKKALKEIDDPKVGTKRMPEALEATAACIRTNR